MSKLGQENFGLMKMFLEMRDLRPGWNGLFELSRFIGKRVVTAGNGAQKKPQKLLIYS